MSKFENTELFVCVCVRVCVVELHGASMNRSSRTTYRKTCTCSLAKREYNGRYRRNVPCHAQLGLTVEPNSTIMGPPHTIENELDPESHNRHIRDFPFFREMLGRAKALRVDQIGKQIG